MTIWRMRIACWVGKATDAPSQYAILNCFFHGKTSCTNGYQWYVVRTLPVLLVYITMFPVLRLFVAGC